MTKRARRQIQGTEVIAVEKGQKVEKRANRDQNGPKRVEKAKKVRHHLWKHPIRVVLIVFFDENNYIWLVIIERIIQS